MTVFLVLGVLGLALLVVSIVLGEVLDGIWGAFPGDVLSTAAVGGFLAAFGFAGSMTEGALGAGGATGVGVVAGLGVGGAAGWMTRSLARSRTDETPTGESLLGLAGTVVTAIPSQGYGEVSVTVHGHLTKLNARADEDLLVGTPVRVTATLSPTSVMVVRRAS